MEKMGKNYKVSSTGCIKELGRVTLNEQLALTGSEISINELPAGVSIPFVHAHKRNEEVYVILSGKGRFFIDGDEFEAEAGDLEYDHASNDWRDVISKKINVPTAIFTGEYSINLPSQRWMASVIPNARLYAYTKEDQGDHFLMFKNPFKFTQDLRDFLEH